MPLETRIALISTIEDTPLDFQDLGGTSLEWVIPPPKVLTPYKYFRCICTGPASGYQIALKYGGLICRVNITAWGYTCRKSSPTYHDIEVINISDTLPYRLEIIYI